MKMKRGLFFLCISFILILLFVNLASAQPLEGVRDGLESAEKVGEGIETYSDQRYWEEKWDYLGQEWKTILLKNRAIAFVDGFFEKTSFVFVVLFGEGYGMSLVLIGIIILWLLVWSVAYDFIKSSGFVSKHLSIILSLLFAVGIAQVGALRKVVLFAGRFMFSPESAWARILLIFGAVFILIFVKAVAGFLGSYIEAKREEDDKRLEKLNRTILGKFMENFLEFSK